MWQCICNIGGGKLPGVDWYRTVTMLKNPQAETKKLIRVCVPEEIHEMLS
jgi:hypothetical protein